MTKPVFQLVPFEDGTDTGYDVRVMGDNVWRWYLQDHITEGVWYRGCTPDHRYQLMMEMDTGEFVIVREDAPIERWDEVTIGDTRETDLIAETYKVLRRI